jgi:hypothetical protein
MQVNMYKYPLTNMLECVKMFFSWGMCLSFFTNFF